MKYICELRGWIYDENKGAERGKIEPGTKFEDLPEDYKCPYCCSQRPFI